MSYALYDKVYYGKVQLGENNLCCNVTCCCNLWVLSSKMKTVFIMFCVSSLQTIVTP